MEKFCFTPELIDFERFAGGPDIRATLEADKAKSGAAREQKRIAGQVATALQKGYREAVALQRSAVELEKFSGGLAQKAKPRGTKEMLIGAKVPAEFIKALESSRGLAEANLGIILERFEFARREIDKYVSGLGDTGFSFSIFSAEYFGLREQAAALKGLTKEVRGAGARSAVAQSAGRPRKLDIQDTTVIASLAASFKNLASRLKKMLGNLKAIMAKLDTAISYASGLNSKNVQGALSRLQKSVGDGILSLSGILSKYEQG